MKETLGMEVAAMLNIESGKRLYTFNPPLGIVERTDCPAGFWVNISGYEGQLIVTSLGHTRGFRFRWRQHEKPNERFDWAAIHKRVEKLLAEGRAVLGTLKSKSFYEQIGQGDTVKATRGTPLRQGRSHITGPRSKPLEGPLRETVKFLRNQCMSFLKDRANVGDIEVAITEFRAAVAEQKATAVDLEPSGADERFP